MPKRLDVLIAGKPAGVLLQDESGAHTFRYFREYRGVPLSSAMPLSTQVYRDKVVLPYLWGLLPEDPAARRCIASDAGVSPNNPFALLGVVGLDCPGAVQFCSEEAQTPPEERLVPASEADIARRLFMARNDNPAWIAENEHWSLGGQQSKFALRKQEGKWFFCEGAAATTHILKSGVKGLAHQALNEYVCMRLARECGISVSQVDYCEFEGERGVEPAIVVERYDRVVSGDRVVRLHQEDLCQALGCLPENKYTMYGGPGCADVLGLMLSTGTAAQTNAAGFLQMMFFNYLLAATDAHAKNFSLLLNSDGIHRLAPLYDVASIAPYVGRTQWSSKPPKLAMSMGGENRIGFLSLDNLANMVERCGLEQVGITTEGCANLICFYAEIIPENLAKVFDGLEETALAEAARELRQRMEGPVARLCEKSKARLRKDKKAPGNLEYRV